MYKNLNAHSNIYNSQRVETIQMSIKWLMDKQNEAYPHNGYYFALKGHESADIGDNTDESWKHYAKKPATESPYITSFYLYEMSRIGKSIETENRIVVARSWGECRTGSDCEWVWGFFSLWWKCSGIK